MWVETSAASVMARFTGHSQNLSSTHLHRMHNCKCDYGRLRMQKCSKRGAKSRHARISYVEGAITLHGLMRWQA